MTIKKSILYLILLSFLLIGASCDTKDNAIINLLFSNEEIDDAALLPNSKNNLGEILVVLNKNYWDGRIDSKLSEHFCNEITTTPMPWGQEFDLKYIDPKGFNGTINTDNMILFFDIDNQSQKKVTSFYHPLKDLYAKNQLIFEIPSMNEENVIAYLERYSDSIKKTINSKYQSWLTNRLNFNTSINKYLNKNHKLSLLTPPGMKLLNSSSEITMLGKTIIKNDDYGDHEIQQRIFVYSYPYNDQALFTQKKQINIRDSICKIHVKGRLENSYMTTAKDKDRPIESTVQLHNNNYSLETRGSWRVINDRMGGAFISVAIHDQARNRIVTIEGNLYAPNFSKREFIREMEAIVYSYQFMSQ